MVNYLWSNMVNHSILKKHGELLSVERLSQVETTQRATMTHLGTGTTLFPPILPPARLGFDDGGQAGSIGAVG
ncbi:hypothetical protein ACH5RR_026172 [Cinchona calisaya]|uniref:Uncharacterized protein n=1 Tax=Cinchona calisaya TaxID=153742 RepID=A0ABD2Z1S8_9GENT